MALVELFLVNLLMSPLISCWNDGAVLLRDVQVLTLYRGRYTAARRSSPVLQLQCVGGSAGCTAFVPEAVQCQNKGWDGVDVQWECKADMDNWYRFGKVEVSCEGYNSPDDPYILRGSCGLEYTLELTAEGRQKQGSHGSFGFSDFASGFFQGKQQHGSSQHFPSGLSGEGSGSMLILAVFLMLAFAVYKIFLSDSSRSSHEDGHQGPNGAGYSNMGPPPPGFRSEYTDSRPGYGFTDSCNGPHAADCGGSGFGGGLGGLGDGLGGLGGLGGGVGGGRNRGGGGFWSGMGTGGLLGYLFGSQRRSPPVNPHGPPFHGTSNHTNTSSGTRTASGFGGTKRR